MGQKEEKTQEATKDSTQEKNVCYCVSTGCTSWPGGRSNHHPGNKRYREEVVNFRPLYASLETDKEKTDMSQRLVDVIEQFGGRFLEEDKVKDGNSWISLGWYVVPNIVARRKAGQALREDNDPEKRKAKRARFLAKKKAAEPLC